VERKLTAILCADVFGYSRLMGEDEEASLGALSSHRKLIDSLIEQHHGRFVNSAGDSVLAEFASVVNAVQCAAEIQSTLKSENGNLPPERRMEFRIGVNLGDVMVDGEPDLLRWRQRRGAPRESRTTGRHLHFGYRPCANQEQAAFELRGLGEQRVKNIARPVRAGSPPTQRPRRESDRRSC
jgi:adenylate cyclase